jgi:hypothetical protein
MASYIAVPSNFFAAIASSAIYRHSNHHVSWPPGFTQRKVEQLCKKAEQSSLMPEDIEAIMKLYNYMIDPRA